jgi:hypothetical protein
MADINLNNAVKIDFEDQDMMKESSSSSSNFDDYLPNMKPSNNLFNNSRLKKDLNLSRKASNSLGDLFTAITICHKSQRKNDNSNNGPSIQCPYVSIN